MHLHTNFRLCFTEVYMLNPIIVYFFVIKYTIQNKKRLNFGSLVQILRSNYCIPRNIRSVLFFTLSLHCQWTLIKTEQNQNNFYFTVSGQIQNGTEAFASVEWSKKNMGAKITLSNPVYINSI